MNLVETFLDLTPEDLKIDKFELFLSWCQTNGVLMPKLEYPAYFEGGLLGTKVKENIEHREAYLYVPYNLMISVKDSQEVLSPIINSYPNLFSEDQCDWE